jgi:hypothetical protein
MRQVHKTVTVIEHDRRRPQKAKLAGKFYGRTLKISDKLLTKVGRGQ